MGTDARFRRPQQHEKLLNTLTDEGPFNSMVEVLLFVAALGKQHDRRTPFEKSGEAIRYALVESKAFGDVLVDMLSVSEHTEDPEILRDDRLEERLRIFEEYGNGGLEYLQGEFNRRAATVTSVVAALVTDRLATKLPAEQADISDIADQLSW